MEQSEVRPRRPPPLPVVTHTPSNQTSEMNETCRFIQLHHKAFTEINKALGFDEQGNGELALTSYKAGVQLMEEALTLSIPQHESSDVSSKREKMMSTLSYAKVRVQELSPSTTNHGSAVPSSRQTGLPTYEEAVSPSEDHPSSSNSVPCNADVLLEISKAQVFFITAEGYVSAPSYPSPLRICTFVTQSVTGVPEHFLQIGTFTLPLANDLTPSLQTSQRCYVFPDITAADQGAAVGILVDDATPAEHVMAFESMLASLSAMRSSTQNSNHRSLDTDVNVATQPPAANRQTPGAHSQDIAVIESPLQPTQLSTKISQGLTTAADWVSWGLTKGAEKVGGLLAKGGEKLRENLQPATEDKELDVKYKRGFTKARGASSKVVEVSTSVVKKLGDATAKLGKKAVPFITTTSKKILPEKVTNSLVEKNESGRSKTDNVKEVGGAGLKSIGVIFGGLQKAAMALGSAIAQETSATVTHKYGNEYGAATNDALYTVGNTLLSVHNVKQFGPSHLARRAVLDTAGAALVNPDTPSPNSAAATSGESGPNTRTLEITEITPKEELSPPKP